MPSKIEWLDGPDGSKGETWNPVVGCSRVSAGCDNCYAMGVAHRKMQAAHEGLTKLRPPGSSRPGVDWTGAVKCLPDRLATPLRWRKPRRVFVNSMSDLFHEQVPWDFIAQVFGVMWAASHHTFIVLTKRPEWARVLFATVSTGRVTRWGSNEGCPLPDMPWFKEHAWTKAMSISPGRFALAQPWPPPNVILGVSVEDQPTADERIPILLDIPAAIRAVSYEPALGPVDFSPWIHTPPGAWIEVEGEQVYDSSPGGLGWVIVGGESGPGARPFEVDWARAVVKLCKAATVPVFVKQLGAQPYIEDEAHPHDIVTWMRTLDIVDRKGSDPSEWPEDLRVRQWPEVRHA